MLKLKKTIKTKGFTLAELVTAVAVLAMLAGFISVIFKSSIDGYRSAGANTEIMQKFRAITEQLNTDFEGFCKDGYLRISEVSETKPVYKNSDNIDVRMDRIYYFTTGNFQSWFDPDIKSNIARVFWRHDRDSIDDLPLSECRLARNVMLLTPDVNVLDSNTVSFSECKSGIGNLEDPDKVLDTHFSMDFTDPNNINNLRMLFCENIGEFKIEWSLGEIDSGSKFVWYSDDVGWGPDDTKPKALKFTFTLYDSKGILQGGRRFTHIVYLGE